MKMYIELGALVWEHIHCEGIFARSKLTLDAIRPMHAAFYDMLDDSRLDTPARYPDHWIILKNYFTRMIHIVDPEGGSTCPPT